MRRPVPGPYGAVAAGIVGLCIVIGVCWHTTNAVV
jgi:hypothetical protein